ncbi:uncharacterized protein K441DRAFT_686033 [Cenococcum geophilum 1.58]|uniref:uncharacterized protein n=1 Tax=Cenococcum geophilum 1.58 TaxID=794803 RepID=UPI00358F3109|nr:hypothetical protein K441DRAFT_686033 [Cenococcum geophilum 1.58]
MSWMDSWSRPSKHAASPPPLYPLPGVSNTKASTTPQHCRKHKPGKLDHQIESTFVSLLNGSDLPPAQGITDPEEWRSVDMEDAPLTHLDEASDEQPPSYIGGAGKIRRLQILSEVNGSIGEREMVRSAARRGCIFGLLIRTKDNGEKKGRRECDVVMNGQVVEPNFTKGEWSIRWRE